VARRLAGGGSQKGIRPPHPGPSRGHFADYFVICSGTNQRQNQAIWDEVAQRMKKVAGEMPISVEGYENAEWILGDYGDVIVHVFSEEKREYYQLERLWRDAKDVPVPPEAAA
jgi:ribosome-associated protein